jgi:hypothetical protein
MPAIRGRSVRILIGASGAGVVALAAGGFTLSFASLRDLATRCGIDPQLSFLWPLIVDGFIVVATAAAFALKDRGPAVTWYPWTALVIFSAVSVTGNSLHGAEAAHASVPLIVAAAVSSIPAIALLVATHLLVVMVEGARAATAEAASRQEGAASPAGAAADGPELAPAQVDLLAQLRSRRDAGYAITGSLIAELEGVSERTGRRRLEVLKQDIPDLFVPSEQS